MCWCGLAVTFAFTVVSGTLAVIALGSIFVAIGALSALTRNGGAFVDSADGCPLQTDGNKRPTISLRIARVQPTLD